MMNGRIKMISKEEKEEIQRDLDYWKNAQADNIKNRDVSFSKVCHSRIEHIQQYLKNNDI